MENKRGQEGLTIGTLLLIILGVVVLVVLIIGATTGFDFIFGKFKLLPGQDLQSVVKSCEISAQNNLKADYCKQFKEVTLPSGQESSINCEYVKEQGLLTEVDNVPTCAENEEVLFCQSIKAKEGERYKPGELVINGKSCSFWGVN